MINKEYTVSEMKKLLDSMAGMYDLARIVDPIECRILKLSEDGTIGMSESCYGIWNSDQKCANCSSAVACKTGCHQEKSERFKDNVYHIQSNPVKMKLTDGGVYNAVVELVSIGGAGDEANDREAENVDGAAARYRVLHDPLTGTLNAEVFHETARELIVNDPGTSWTLITGDIMEFRLFSSLFGVEKANEALKIAGELLEAIASGSGGICSRLYRDKYAILIPSEGYSEDALKDAAGKLRSFVYNGIYTLYIHFGVYEVKNPSTPISVMCDRANMALRTIHRDADAVVAYFNDEIMKKGIFEQEIISGFDEALAGGQFKMYLQPLTFKDGTPFGAEALVRWIHTDGAVISPAVFIGILESAGLIHKLDSYIWGQAVKQLAAWKNTACEGLTISVNMSPKDFYSIDIYETLTGLTAKYGVDNSKLRIEITEGAIIDRPEVSYPVISKLRSAGFAVEIDDFGKGQSSLSLLKDIQVDILKIDMGFLRETENVIRSQIILRSVITMANELGLQVIAEGVETERQLESLSCMGCSRFQGYYFSRPVPAEDFLQK